jgi:hypothetical protein
MENKLADQQNSQLEAEVINRRNSDKAVTDQYDAAISSIRSGLEAGGDIELIIPFTLRLIALKDLSGVLADINNPTSESIGTSFTEIVIEAASSHLLPRYKDPSKQENAKNRFKTILSAIYKGPMIQALLNSNPISATINAAVQQAGLFETDRPSELTLTRAQIREPENNPITLNTANSEGASFTNTEMEAFNNQIAKRVEFYAKMSQYGYDQGDVTQQLYIDAKIIKKTAKASETEICKLLDIDPLSAQTELSRKYTSNLSVDSMKIHLNDPDFKKAISLSDYANEQLPDVRIFYNTVVEELIKYIDGYIQILNDYKEIQEADLDPRKVDSQIEKMKRIKSTLSNPNGN